MATRTQKKERLHKLAAADRKFRKELRRRRKQVEERKNALLDLPFAHRLRRVSSTTLGGFYRLDGERDPYVVDAANGDTLAYVPWLKGKRLMRKATDEEWVAVMARMDEYHNIPF